MSDTEELRKEAEPTADPDADPSKSAEEDDEVREGPFAFQLYSYIRPSGSGIFASQFRMPYNDVLVPSPCFKRWFCREQLADER